MRKSKQAEDRAAQASSIVSSDEAPAQWSDRNSGPEDLGELATEVQSFITQRNELARRLNHEIEATEKKLAELKRTKERLFPEGSVEILCELERQERKPKRTTKGVKTPHQSPDVQPAKEFVSRGESPSHLMIHRIDDDLETDGEMSPIANRSPEVAEPLASHYIETAVAAGAQYLDLSACAGKCGSPAVYPGRSVDALHKVLDLPVVDLLPHEPLCVGRLWSHSITDRRGDSAQLLAVEPGRVLSTISLGQTRSIILPSPSGLTYQSPTLATTVPMVARLGVAHFCLQLSHASGRENAA